MDFQLCPLTDADALAISGWSYPEPWSVYNLAGGPAGLAELLNGEYYKVQDNHGQLVGFFCFGNSAQVPFGRAVGVYGQAALDIGLGLRPDLTGQGLGLSFLQAGLCFATSHLGADSLRLTVLGFNQRAITVYRRAGFAASADFEAPGTTGSRTFLVMIKQPTAR